MLWLLLGSQDRQLILPSSRGRRTLPEIETEGGLKIKWNIFSAKFNTITNFNSLQLYMTIHSYGQYFMYPWGHQKIDVGDWKHLHSLAEAANEGFKSKGGYSYQIGSAAKMLYEASGK